MAAPTVLNLLPRNVLEPLRMLGRHEWLIWKQSFGDVPSSDFQLQFPDTPEIARHDHFLDSLRKIAGVSPASLFHTFALSKLLANGPKVLRPTADQCQALEHVDVHLSFDEYEQPFPVFLVELPESYRRSLTDRFGHPASRFVMIFHDRPSSYIVTTCEYGPGRDGTICIMSPRPYWSSIEDALHYFAEEDGPDLHLAEVVYRVAINFGLASLLDFMESPLRPI